MHRTKNEGRYFASSEAKGWWLEDGEDYTRKGDLGNRMREIPPKSQEEKGIKRKSEKKLEVRNGLEQNFNFS